MPISSLPTAPENDATDPKTATTTSTALEPGQLHEERVGTASKRAKLLTTQPYLTTTSDSIQLPTDANLQQSVATLLPISTQPSFQPILSTTPSDQPFPNCDVQQSAISVPFNIPHRNVGTASQAYLQCNAALAAAAHAASAPR